MVRKIHGLLATARVANVPSVLSNLGVGVFLGSVAADGDFEWPWLLSLAVVLFYVTGNFLNDWADRDWDREHRPERALPQGMFLARSYLVFVVVGMMVGLGIAASYGLGVGVVSVILVGLILIYTKIHKKTAFSVVPMGLCRACLPILGYLAMGESMSATVLYPALALLVYVLALSISARWESRGEIGREKKIFAWGLLVFSGLIAAGLVLVVNPMLAWLGLVPFGVWLGISLTRYRSPVSAQVSALLAGIPLVDWIILLPIALTLLGHEKMGWIDPALYVGLFLAPVSFVLGRVLQRVASAT